MSEEQEFCYRCLIHYASAEHHILGRGKPDSDEYLIPLCTECHDLIHRTGTSNHVDSLFEAKEFALGYFATSE